MAQQWNRLLPMLWGSRASRPFSVSTYTTMSPEPSYWHQPGSRPLIYKTLGQLLEDSARKFGDQQALVSVEEGVRLSFNELLRETDRVAAGFRGLGLQSGDRIAIWAPNSWRWVVCRLAAARAGMLAVDMNPLYCQQEAIHCLRLARVAAVVAAEEYRGVRPHETLTGVAPEILRSPGRASPIRSAALPDLRRFITLSDKSIPGAVRYSDVVGAVSAEEVQAVRDAQDDISPDSACNIQFSSGTTGSPKAIVLRHRSIVNTAHTFGVRLTQDQLRHKVCLLLPLFHVAGSICSMTTSLHYGSTMVLPSAKYDPQSTLEAIVSERCSILVGTPTIYVDLVQLVEKKSVKLDGLYAAVTGGASISPELVKRILQVLNMERLCAVFGLSETCASVFQGQPGDSVDRMANTIGQVCEHVEVKVVDQEGKMVPFGTSGELLVRGPLTMQEYYQDEKATREALENGWLRTGDRCILQDDGYGRVVGRIKDMIIRGGENIYPAEVESFLITHPDIIDVHVIGVPDERMGEEVCACLRVRGSDEHLSAKDLREFCLGKIASFKIPRYCHVVQVFPQTPSGKVQKYKLREHCEKLLRKGELDDSRSALS